MGLLTWTADHLFGWLRRRRKIATEIAENDAKARELQTDLDRWMADRGRRLDAELRGIVNGAGPHLYAGSLRNGLEQAMELALEQYRNEASAKVREFKRVARSEGPVHAKRRKGTGPRLALTDEGRAVLARWRERPYPVPHTGSGPLRPHDSTAHDEEVAPLEQASGLSWTEATRRAS